MNDTLQWCLAFLLLAQNSLLNFLLLGLTFFFLIFRNFKPFVGYFNNILHIFTWEGGSFMKLLFHQIQYFELI